ncbi:MAG TPA: hydrogenase maturation protease [Terracidiphilus sp.]|jgi:hydrogenase maturation protease|nr:hydrogenase maturation protease [Terracidiphilus sp.]
MSANRIPCLILACGNSLRGDDGVGPWLAQWASGRFRAESLVRVLASQQWAPEMAEEIAGAKAVIFIDSSMESAPGAVKLAQVQPATGDAALSTHHLGAAELLGLGCELYGYLPRTALLLTVGIETTALREEFSDAVKASLPEACNLLEHAVQRLLTGAELWASVHRV